MKTTDEINALLIDESQKQRVRYSAAKADYSKKYGFQGLFVSDIMGIICNENRSVEQNLRNALAIANNNMVAGLHNEYLSLSLEKKLKREKILKQAAFLFILKCGLTKEFRTFINNYHGDMEEDISREQIKIV